MKISQQKDAFVPLVLTLESQEKVNALFYLVNHMNICEVFLVLDTWYDELEDFVEYDGEQVKKLEEIIKKD